MTPGKDTTEHVRALRGEGACGLLAAVGAVGILTATWSPVVGSFLLAAGVLGHALIAVTYAHSRSTLKAQEARAAADIKTAEAMSPKQRVV